jgi:hypothetical protein
MCSNIKEKNVVLQQRIIVWRGEDLRFSGEVSLKR